MLESDCCRYETSRKALWQRMEPVAGGSSTHTNRHEATVEYGNRRLSEWQLYKVLRS